MYNRVILMGRICHDLEMKTTSAGIPVLSFRIAVERNYQVKGEDRKADFFNIVAWRNNAEFISRYFFKGRMILIEGELQTRQYADKNNITRDIVEIIVDHSSFTGEPKQQSQGNNYQSSQNGGGYSSQPQQPTAQSAQSTLTQNPQTPDNYDDDYPF